MFRVLVICGCLLAVTQAGVISGGLIATGPGAVSVQPAALQLPAGIALPTLSATSSNIIRGIGNLGAISADSKSIDTPFSSVRKADVRVTNPGIVTATAVHHGPLLAFNSGLAGQLATASVAGPTLIGHGLTTAVAGPGIATTGISGPYGINGLTLNGLGHVKII